MSEAGRDPPPAMITGTISLGDLAAAQRLHTRRTLQVLRYLPFALIAVGLLLLAFGQVLVGAAIAGTALASVFAERSGRKLGHRMLAKMYEQHVALHSTLSYWWDEEGIGARNDLGQSKRPWSSYVRVREGEDTFLLYQTDSLYELVPKAWFVDQAQMDEFRRVSRAIA